MNLDRDKTERILRFALLSAGEEDIPFERQLGPIHLLKYVYLADLAYAKRHQGEPYTGAEWRFHKFGPWCYDVHQAIDPALRSVGAERRDFRSDFGSEDWVRYSMRNRQMLSDEGRHLPPAITVALKRDVHRFGGDTASLLDYVYKTAPMLNAAPSEMLDFSIAAQQPSVAPGDAQETRFGKLSAKRKKALAKRLSGLRERVRVHGSEPIELVDPAPNAEYDEVFWDGVAWLDELAGPMPAEGDLVAEFSNDVWHSPARGEGDVP